MTHISAQGCSRCSHVCLWILVQCKLISARAVWRESTVFPCPGMENCSYLNVDCVDVTLVMRIYKYNIK